MPRIPVPALRKSTLNSSNMNANPTAAPPESATDGIVHRIEEYLALTKPGILALLLFTTLGAMVVAAHGVPDFWLMVITLIGGWMTAGGANVYNCVIDRDIDAMMPRTRSRGTANGRISALAATIWGTCLTLGGALLLGLAVNWVAAAVALAGNFYYVVIYTMILKRRTSQNIVIGGAAGAMPPMVGWAAVTGSLSVEAWILFALIFYWTPPHFWALALLKQGEYGRVHVPMMPNVVGEEQTREQILLYTFMLVAVSLMLQLFGMNLIYLMGAAVLGLYYIYLAYKLKTQPSKAMARRAFFYSIWYMAGIFSIMMIDQILL